MNLAIFDIDGTLTESVAVDEVCFIQAFRDVLGIEGISTNWLGYAFQTDSGLALEICRTHLDRDPGDADMSRLQARFLELLRAATEGVRRALREVPGAAAFLHRLRALPRWRIALATGGWAASARFKLTSAGLPGAAFPWATADDGLDRVDILRTAIRRAERTYGQDTFRRLVYVGDGVWDVRAAKAVGIGFLGIAAGDRARRLVEEGASFVVTDFTDPVRVGGCLEALARRYLERGRHDHRDSIRSRCRPRSHPACQPARLRSGR